MVMLTAPICICFSKIITSSNKKPRCVYSRALVWNMFCYSIVTFLTTGNSPDALYIRMK
jgi:hypothetical protein